MPIKKTNHIILIFVTIFIGCSNIPDDKQVHSIQFHNNWQVLDTEKYPGKRDDISFADHMHGWYGTGKGNLYATQDGGDNWSLVTSKPGTFIRALGFINNETGFIGNVGTDYYPGVTDETPLYRTNDGGKTWTAVNLNGEKVKGICAIDILKTENIYQGKLQANTVIHAAGRVGGPAGIIRSLDGGDTWTVIDMQKHAGMILDIKFFDEQTGLVFASTSDDVRKAEGLILRTEDGGQTWESVYKSGRLSELIWKASFPEDRYGYATVQSYDKERTTQLILKTDNNGKTWKEIPMVENAKARQFGIGFTDKNHGWIGTMEGGFYTSDGGQTFISTPINKAANKFRIIQTKKGKTVYAIGTEVQRLKLLN